MNYLSARLKVLGLPILALLSVHPSFAAVNDATLEPLWFFASQLKNSIGRDAAVLDSIIETPIERINPDFANRLTAGPLTLDGGIEISNVVIRLTRKHPGRVYIISYDVGNVCITLKDVKKTYPELILLDVPRGHAINETFSWITPVDTNGNGTGFGFPQSKPSCLKNMTLRNFTS